MNKMPPADPTPAPPAELPPDGFDGDDDGGDSHHWVTVATFWQPTAAHIARLKLDGEGIDCLIVDENLVAMNWFLANAIGGIKLQVPENDAVRATQLLTTHAQTAVALADGEPVYDGLERCPQCGSDDIHTTRFSRRAAFLSMLVLGAPLPFPRRRRRCAACGLEWRPE